MNIRIRLRKLFTPTHIHHPDGSETAASYIAPNWLLIGSVALLVVIAAFWLA